MYIFVCMLIGNNPSACKDSLYQIKCFNFEFLVYIHVLPSEVFYTKLSFILWSIDGGTIKVVPGNGHMTVCSSRLYKNCHVNSVTDSCIPFTVAVWVNLLLLSNHYNK